MVRRGSSCSSFFLSLCQHIFVPRDIFGSLSILFTFSNHSSLHKKTGQKKELDIFEKERYHVDRLIRVNVQIIIVYLFAQKTFIAGLTSGSVKG